MLRSASLVVIMATGVAAFAPAFSRLAGGMRRPLGASARMTRRVSSPLSLRAQLGDMPQVEADASGQELPEITGSCSHGEPAACTPVSAVGPV